MDKIAFAFSLVAIVLSVWSLIRGRKTEALVAQALESYDEAQAVPQRATTVTDPRLRTLDDP